MAMLVVTTCNNGELRIYDVVKSDPVSMINQAQKIDESDYPDNPSNWENVSIIEGRQLYDIVWGEVL